MKQDPIVRITDEHTLKRVAYIMGDMSAAAQAIKRAAEYRASGAENVYFAYTRLGTLLVISE
jgi:predicted RNA-binding protein YlxR (DUF448 family)